MTGRPHVHSYLAASLHTFRRTANGGALLFAAHSGHTKVFSFSAAGFQSWLSAHYLISWCLGVLKYSVLGLKSSPFLGEGGGHSDLVYQLSLLCNECNETIIFVLFVSHNASQPGGALWPWTDRTEWLRGDPWTLPAHSAAEVKLIWVLTLSSFALFFFSKLIWKLWLLKRLFF